MDHKKNLLRLEDIIEGEVIGEWSKEYEAKLRGYWNILAGDFRPIAFIVPFNANDVVAGIKFCTNNKIPVTVRSGGHESSISCYTKNSIVFDLSRMRKIKLDRHKQVAKIQSGAFIGEVDKLTSKEGLAGTFGTHPTVGVGGQAMNLGIGYIARTSGMLIDNIIEYRLVDVRGYQLTINKNTNPDLFWAMKMCGANFGITTEITIKLYKIPYQIFAGSIQVQWADAAEAIRYFRNISINEGFPKEASMSLRLRLGNKGFVLIVRISYMGDAESGMEWYQTIKDKCPVELDDDDLQVRSYTSLQNGLEDEFPSQCLVKIFPNQFLTDIPDGFIEAVMRCMSRLSPDEHVTSTFLIILMGGAIKEIPQESTPFPFRDANYFCHMVGIAKTREGYREIEAMENELREEIEQYDMPPDMNHFLPALEKLNVLKTKHDPKNVFRYNWFNIDPTKNDS